MRKLLCIILTVCMVMGFMIVAMADEVEPEAMVVQIDNMIRVYGTTYPNEQVTVLVGNVFEDGMTDEQIAAAVQYIDQIETDENGNFEFEFLMRDPVVDQEYALKVGGSSLDDPIEPYNEDLEEFGKFKYQDSGSSDDGKITGYVTLLAERTDKSGILVEVKDGNDVIETTYTNADGKFEVEVDDGTYDIVISIVGYLARTISGVVVSGGEATLSTEVQPVDLWAGDVNEDDAVNIHDLSPLLTMFGKTASSEEYDPAVDFNSDDAINIHDLSPLLSNFGKTSNQYPEFSLE